MVAALILTLASKGQAQTDEETLLIAKEYAEAGLSDKAIEILVPPAVGGDPRAQLLLGSVYVAKRNESDYFRGHSWAARAAKQGEPGAFVMLWGTLDLDPENNNYNPHGTELGPLLREQYAHSLLFITAELIDHPMFRKQLTDRRRPEDRRVDLTAAQIEEAERIAAACMQSDYDDCPPLEVFIRQ